MTDNFASNEIIVARLSARVVRAQPNGTTCWPTYHSDVADIRFHDNSSPLLSMDACFRLTTFSFLVKVQIAEYAPPAGGQVVRAAWHGWVESDATTHLDVICARFFGGLSGKCVCILTQESQIGVPARELACTLPGPTINSHQEWVADLTRATRDT